MPYTDLRFADVTTGTLKLYKPFFIDWVEVRLNDSGDPAPCSCTCTCYETATVDDDTGLQNNLHRWYDPNTGRWISQDPIGFEAGDANLYRYVGNEATMYVDPDGREQ